MRLHQVISAIQILELDMELKLNKVELKQIIHSQQPILEDQTKEIQIYQEYFLHNLKSYQIQQDLLKNLQLKKHFHL